MRSTLIFVALIAVMAHAAVLPSAGDQPSAPAAADAAAPAFVDEAQQEQLQQQDSDVQRRDAPATANATNSNSNVFAAADSVRCSSPSLITTPGSLYTNAPGTSYSNYQTCTWYIVAPYGQVPRLSFSSFNTETNFDFLTVYNGYGASSSTQLFRNSGSSVPTAITASSQYMTVTFTSDLSIVFSGVVASVSFVTVGGCSGPTYITATGTAIDTNPAVASYVNGQACTWYITAPAGYAPQLSFVRFNTESSFDYLTVYNGPSNAYSQLLRTSGSTMPAITTATQNYMTVTFSADVSIVASGVRAIVTFVPVGACSSPSYITSTGTQINTNFGVAAYSNGQSCTWTIVAPYGYRPQLVFSGFTTEISFDWFSVYNGASTAATTLMRRSGSGVPAAITASQQYMTVTFTSDSSIVYSGVQATVYFV